MLLVSEYDLKNFGKVKTIIGWKMTRAAWIMKIDQSTFIRDLVVEKRLIKCKAKVIPIKVGSTIEITVSDNCNKINFQEY